MKRFYFNHEVLPPLATAWGLCRYGRFLNDYRDDWDEEIGYRQIYIVSCRIDHDGAVESENPAAFLIAAQELLLKHLQQRGEVLGHIEECVRNINDRAAEHADTERIDERPMDIYMVILQGLQTMIASVEREGIAFWTTGDERDREMLLHRISRSALSPEDPEYLLPPHVRHREDESRTRIGQQKQELSRYRDAGWMVDPFGLNCPE